MNSKICTKKKLTASYAGALLYLAKKAREEEGDTRRKEVRAYFCSKCKAWHLTSQQDEEKYTEQNKVFIKIQND